MNTRAHVTITSHPEGDYVVAKCPMGHLLEARKIDRDFAGSMLQADLAYRKPGDRWDRMAAKCCGAGH